MIRRLHVQLLALLCQEWEITEMLDLYVPTLICTLVDDPDLLNANNERFMT